MRTTFLCFGTSKTQWASIPLPLDLSAIGMPSCSLFVSAENVFSVPNVTGFTTWSVQIPLRGELLGGSFFNQALVGDPPANALGLIVSNGGEAIIGY